MFLQTVHAFEACGPQMFSTNESFVGKGPSRSQVAESRAYPANLCPLFGVVEFAGFGEDLGEAVNELI